jgi:antagonist of KipI
MLTQSNTEQLVSSGVMFGTIQLLPNGSLVILAVDHPTTGGYPRIENIISVHLPKLAQISPGVKLRFFTTSVLNAANMFLLQQKEIKQMQTAVKLQLPALQARI